jgi:hypothetical protein
LATDRQALGEFGELRIVKDWECLNRSALAFLRWASVRLTLQRPCQDSE